MLAAECALYKKRFSDCPDMIVHYNMLHSAVTGCARCVKNYAHGGGDVRRGSQNAPLCDAWRASFESQTLEAFQDQEAVHEYFKDLPGADDKIKKTQKGWGRHKLLQTARELGEQLRGRDSEGSVIAGEPASASSRPRSERKKRSNAENTGEDATRQKRLRRLREASYEGQQHHVASILEQSADLLWETTSGPMGVAWRAVDHARYGRCAGMPSMETVNYLLQLGETRLMMFSQDRFAEV